MLAFEDQVVDVGAVEGTSESTIPKEQCNTQDYFKVNLGTML